MQEGIIKLLEANGNKGSLDDLAEKLKTDIIKLKPELKILINDRKITIIDENVILNPKEQWITEETRLDSFREEILLLLMEKKRATATEIMVERFLNENYIYTIRDDETTEIWIYRDGIYIPEGKTYIKEYCRNVLLTAYTNTLAKLVVDKIEVDTYIDSERFFKVDNPYEIAVKNGILNIKTRELNSFDPERVFFNKINANYDPNAKIDKIEGFFNDLLDKNSVEIIQELFGFTLVREYLFETMFMFLGSGANGKSRLLILMERFLNEKNCISIPLNQLIKDQYAIGQLHNKMVNLSADLSPQTLTDPSLLKQLTGKDTISSNRKYKNRITFVNYAKLINSCNELPKTNDLTYGFFRRWILLEFKNYFVKKEEMEFVFEDEKKHTKIANPNIIDDICNEEEFSGLLNWALDGFKRLVLNGGFSSSITTNDMRIKWLRLSNSFEAFCMDMLRFKYGVSETKERIREEYSKYCNKNKLKIENDKIINDVMIRKGVWDERPRDSNRKTIWKGVMIK